MADRVFCRCDGRYAAIRDDGFQFSEFHQGWVFPSDAKRHVSNPWRSEYFGTSNHDGEPIVWHCCPFCGLDLPYVEEPPPPANFCDPQADGN